MSANSPAIALLIFVVMTIFTLWFGQLMLRAVDILYKPSVKKWMLRNLQNKPSWQVPSAGNLIFPCFYTYLIQKLVMACKINK